MFPTPVLIKYEKMRKTDLQHLQGLIIFLK